MDKKKKLILRRATLEDVDSIVKLDHEVWPSFPTMREKIASRLSVFPEGNYVVVCDGEIVGYTCTQLVKYDLDTHPPFTWEEITDNGTLRQSHNLKNPYLYGVVISVSPRFQNLGIGTRLMLPGWYNGVRYNVKAALFGCRMPDYHKVCDKHTPDEYIRLRRDDGQLYDSELRLNEREGFKIIRVLPEYETDPESCNCGVLVVHDNPLHDKFFGWIRHAIAWVILKYGHRILNV